MAMRFSYTAACLAILLVCSVSSTNFDEFFKPNWSPDHLLIERDHVNLTLDSFSELKQLYDSINICLEKPVSKSNVEGDYAGTVTAFYTSSEGPSHDELDFEFLGNVSGQPYLVQTNVYANGTGNREQSHTLWFLVDNIPIRVFENKEESDVAYPKNQAMGVQGSIWNADEWATQGGRVKTNWNNAPFVSAFRSFNIKACELGPESENFRGQMCNVEPILVGQAISKRANQAQSTSTQVGSCKAFGI